MTHRHILHEFMTGQYPDKTADGFWKDLGYALIAGAIFALVIWQMPV